MIRLEDVLKTSWRRIAKTNILVLTKTSSEDVRLRRTHSSWWRRLEDVLKTSSEDEDKVTKTDIEASHRLGNSRTTTMRFVNRKHSFEALKNEKRLCLLILPVLGSIRINIFIWSKTCLTIIRKLYFTAENS